MLWMMKVTFFRKFNFFGRSRLFRMSNRIYIPSLGLEWDYPIIGAIETTTLEHVFVIECLNVDRALCTILGEEYLENKYGPIVYVDIVSKFFSNCMDLLEDCEIVK